MRIPIATYRLQFNPSFGFHEAKKIIEYLSKIGISDLYASPIFKAKKGSLHGYDVVDPNQLNPELGAVEDFEELIKELKKYGMGWLQDIVPNHMAYDSENQMLMDVLENGQCSEYFDFFDIEWDHPYESRKGRVLAPFLGKLYGEALEDGQITLGYEKDGFTINYDDLKFPLKMESYISVITYRFNMLRRRLGEDHPDFIKLLGILYSLKNLPTSREEILERYDQIRFIKRMLWELYAKNREIKGFIDENIQTFNGKRGNPESFNLLDGLLSEQHFMLSFWKVATEEVNYRRFFNINGLISLRMEEEKVFRQTHSLILNLVQDGKFTGLRIDHIDGLYNPIDYLRRLRDQIKELYIVVEKILDLQEELLAFWPVQGTTGYEFLNFLNGVFCDGTNERRFTKIYSSFADFKRSYEELLYEKKKLMIEQHMTGDIDNLAHLLKGISSRDRHGSDLTLYGLKKAMVEILAFFPVYRTYISQDVFSDTDRFYIKEAVKKAKEKNPGLFYELTFIERFLLLDYGDYVTEEEKKDWVHFAMRFQQVTGPLMAKGFEDTTLYVYNRLLSLNEVGGSPNRFGISREEFHEFNRRRVARWPHSLNATSTHDTKRGEDVRARINVLSELPEEWETNLRIWSKTNGRRKRVVNGTYVPDRNDEYFLYQILIGAFPFFESEYPTFTERLKHYIIKAVREAKVHTAWLKPDTDYEAAFLSFLEAILKPGNDNPFLKRFLPFQRKVAYYGIFNSLSQTLLKITSPGVPDFYQGTELWDLNLVDPDNRRPVDFEGRRRFLQEIITREQKDLLTLTAELLSTKEDGRIKLFLIYRALKARGERSDLFQRGDYLPLEVRGRYHTHLIAFARRYERSWALTIVPRLLTHLVEEGEYPLGKTVWDDTSLLIPEGAPSLWEDAITARLINGENPLPICDILRYFPVAFLLSKER